MTQQEKLIAALTKFHYRQVPHTTRKYIVFVKDAANNTYYFVGKMGALRVGPSVKGSMPVSEKVREWLLKEGSYTTV